MTNNLTENFFKSFKLSHRFRKKEYSALLQRYFILYHSSLSNLHRNRILQKAKGKIYSLN